MEAGFVALVLFLLLITAIVIIVCKNRKKPEESQGILNVDYSDPEDGPYLFLQLKVPIADIVSRERVIFDVNIKQYVSQK